MKSATLSLKECYAILGIPPGSDLDTVKHAYRKRAFELHPDLNPGDGASRDFQKLNEAYVVLIRHLNPQQTTGPAAPQGNARPRSPQTGRQAYAEQAREDKARRERERREKQEQERREREAMERRAREQREREERERRETERRERLRREIDRQEAERLARQEKAREDKVRREEALRAAEREREEKLREAGRQQEQSPRTEAYRRSYARPQSSSGSDAAPAGGSASSSASGAAEEAYAARSDEPSREDLLNDLLNDPFARRVYEDIYSEVRNRQNTPAEPPKPRKFNMEWGNKAFPIDLTGGIGHAIKGWMRNQIDEEQELFFPAANLFPGARIRLQIRHGLSGELRTVDITLPQDFIPGKPVRLKGMGKKLGRWQGDLYLTFQIKERGAS